MDLGRSKITCPCKTLLVLHIVDRYDLLHGLDLAISWLYYCCLQMLPSRLLTLLYRLYCWSLVYLTEKALLETNQGGSAPFQGFMVCDHYDVWGTYDEHRAFL